MSDDAWLRALAFVVLIILYNGRWYSKKYLLGEIERNDKYDPPSDRQSQWHLQHMREDFYMIATSLRVLTLLAIAYVVWHW